MKGMILSVIEGEPGRVHLALYDREAGTAARHELTLYEIYRMHHVVTEALYAHATENGKLSDELKRVADQVAKACQPQLCPRGCGAPYREEPEGSHAICPNCRQTIASCCGDI